MTETQRMTQHLTAKINQWDTKADNCQAAGGDPSYFQERRDEYKAELAAL